LDKKIIKSEKELNNYSAYKKLNDYDRYCLLGNNYWNIMNGDYDRVTSVPTQDLHFWFYFNETCFVECDGFQRRKKAEAEERRKNEVLRIDDEFKVEPKKELKIEPEPIIEIKPEPELNKEPEKIAEMPIEENKDFLKEKQEHPVYPKRENLKPDIKKEPEPEKDKKTKKTKKGKNDDQVSMF
jgi:hypothetical protein